MNLSDKLIQCQQANMTSWAKGASILPSTPWLAYINPTNLCNNRCVMCPHHHSMRSDKGIMDMELFMRIVDSLPHTIRKVYLIKQGEPFLNPRLTDMMRYLAAQRPSIHIAIHTNCTVPFSDHADEICTLVHSLGLSVSAVTPDTYARIHGQSMDTVIRNLDALQEALARMPDEKRPHCFIDYIAQSMNAHERIEDILTFYRTRYPLFGSVDIHPAFNWQGDCEEGNLNIYNHLPHERFPSCVFPWSAITYCHDGRIAYCFEEPRENVFLGDARRQTFQEIWNGDPFIRFRSLMAQRRFGELREAGFYCGTCSLLFDCHSQSPQNLAMGYFSDTNSRGREPKYGNLLSYSDAQVLSYAMDCYLAGELHKAIGCLAHIDAVCTDQNVRKMGRVLDALARNMVTQFARIGQWQQTMEQLGDLIPAPQYHRI